MLRALDRVDKNTCNCVELPIHTPLYAGAVTLFRRSQAFYNTPGLATGR